MRVKQAAVTSQAQQDWRIFEKYFGNCPDIAKYYYYLHYHGQRCDEVPAHRPAPVNAG